MHRPVRGKQCSDGDGVADVPDDLTTRQIVEALRNRPGELVPNPYRFSPGLTHQPVDVIGVPPAADGEWSLKPPTMPL